MRLRRSIALYLAIILILMLTGCSGISREPFQAEYASIGIPLESRYYGMRPQTAWDIEICDGKLFVASGDYDENSGPVYMFYYDFAKGDWVRSTILPDEQIERFVWIDDVLMAPGTDPREGWESGNYYAFDGTEWQINRNIPGGIHAFDMISYDDKIILGIGVVAGEYPIAASSDGGQTFQQLTMYRDGQPVSTVPALNPDGSEPSAQIRVYDFFTCDGELYALYCMITDTQKLRTIYRYEDNAFHYYCDLADTVEFDRISYEMITAKAEFKNILYFSTSNFYYATDLKTPQPITLEGANWVADLHIIDDTLYALGVNQISTEEYRISVWYNKTGDPDDFKELFYFNYSCAAQSMTYSDGVFYLGMGVGRLSESLYESYNPDNGSVLAIDIPWYKMP